MKIKISDILILIVIVFVAILSLLKLNSVLDTTKIKANINIEETNHEILKNYNVTDIVSFDPVKYEICDEDKSSETCYNWVVMKKDNNKYELYLQGKYDSMLWTQKNPVDVIKNYTENWSNKLTIDSLYDINVTEEYGYKFSETKARILTKNEYELFFDKLKLLKPYDYNVERYQYLIIDTQNKYFDYFGTNGQYGINVGTYFDYDTNNNQGAYINTLYVRPLINIDLESVGNSTTYEYLVEFMNGNVLWESQNVGPNKKISKPLNPTKEGYKFKYWADINGTEYNFINPVTKSIKLYAVYEEISNNTLRTMNKYDTVDFDPVNYRFCDEDYESDTCFSWVVINKDGTEYDLYSKVINSNMQWQQANPVDIIKSYTQNWDERLSIPSSYDIIVNENYSYKFSETKARMLTAEEYITSGDNIDKIVQRNIIVALMNLQTNYITLSRVDTEYTTYNKSSQNYNLVDYYSFVSNANGDYENKAYIVPVIHINVENVGNNIEKDRANYICRRATKNITLGQLNEKGTLKSGDVFDCNVDATGYTERFYYVTDLEENPEYGVLLYSHNVRNGKIYDFICQKDQDCGQGYNNYFYDIFPYTNGPRLATYNLPTTSQWTNISLYNSVRDIYDTNGIKIVENFDYNDKATRLLTYEEALKACNIPYENIYDSYISIDINDSCAYLTDNLRSHGSDIDTNKWIQKGMPKITKQNNLPWAYWLENVFVSSYMNENYPVFNYSNSRVVRLFGSYQGQETITIDNPDDSSDKTVKPVIEVRKKLIDYGATVKVTYNDEDTIESIVMQKGSKATEIDSKGKANYVFKHWSLSKGAEAFDFNTSIDEDITLYAVYEIENYTITYDLDGGTVTLSNPITYNAQTDTFTLNNPVKENYTFIGWTGSNGEEPQKTIIITKGSSGNKTYKANFEINKYSVEFYEDDKLLDIQIIEHGKKIGNEIIPKVEKDNYEFIGWREKVETDNFDFDTIITKPYKLYAIFKEINKECILSLTSKIYKVDEENKEINNVPENEELSVIQSNLAIEGTIREIEYDHIIIACDDKIKTYKINRIWIPKTGNVLTRGMIIFGYLGIVIILLFVIGKQIDRNKRLRSRL